MIPSKLFVAITCDWLRYIRMLYDSISSLLRGIHHGSTQALIRLSNISEKMGVGLIRTTLFAELP